MLSSTESPYNVSDLYQRYLRWWLGSSPHTWFLTTSNIHNNGNYAFRWRHNDRDSVSNHQPHDCLLNHLFRRRSKKTSKLRFTGLCAGNSPGTVNSPHQWPVTRKMFPFDDVIMGPVIRAQYVMFNLINPLAYDYTIWCHKLDQHWQQGVIWTWHFWLLISETTGTFLHGSMS